MTSVRDDAALARDVAEEAGRVLLGLRAASAEPTASAASAASATSVDSLRDAADAAAHRAVAERLAAERPDDVLFSEEAPDPRRRLAASRVWIVDPLDGTREYGEPGRTDWAVHVALWADGALVAAAVALPALGTVHGTDPAAAGSVPQVPARSSGDEGLRFVVSRSRPPAVARELAADLGAELLLMGSAGAKAAAVWRGEAQAYVHTGGLHEWDAAAPVAVALAAGLHASRLDGAPLEFNRPEPYLPDLLICIPELAGPILARTARPSTEVTHG
jgi:3'(2'), 5'-bisphosphate nucleotidase